MSRHIGVVMDPIESIKPWKDSTLAMLLAARARGWTIAYMELDDLFIVDGEVHARSRELEVKDDRHHWFEYGPERTGPLVALDAILMRKDPPFDMEYLYATYLLEMVEVKGTPVFNRPASIRDCNEKLFALQFPQCCPPHVVSRNPTVLRDFWERMGDVIYKPLDGMGGSSIFHVGPADHNLTVIIETLTLHGQRRIMAQKYLPEIRDGDKRILLIEGRPVPKGLARIPLAGESRGNLAAGGSGVGRDLTQRDLWICEQIGPTLVEKGLDFVGIDVIGDYLTEINVTCPTCIRELDAAYDLDIAGDFMELIDRKLTHRTRD